jgi:hypothetical protein
MKPKINLTSFSSITVRSQIFEHDIIIRIDEWAEK